MNSSCTAVDVAVEKGSSYIIEYEHVPKSGWRDAMPFCRSSGQLRAVCRNITRTLLIPFRRIIDQDWGVLHYQIKQQKPESGFYAVWPQVITNPVVPQQISGGKNLMKFTAQQSGWLHLFANDVIWPLASSPASKDNLFYAANKGKISVIICRVDKNSKDVVACPKFGVSTAASVPVVPSGP
jgi:hypothetical protein